MNKLEFPILEFRPLTDYFKCEFYRYNNGDWILDDGKYDLAFLHLKAFATCLYINLPYYENILWKWVTNHCSGYEPKHPNGNAWHYMLKENTTTWGKGEWARHTHMNIMAGKSGMNYINEKLGYANGEHIEFDLKDYHILAGLVRDRDTKKVLKPPNKPVCMYCGLFKSR